MVASNVTTVTNSTSLKEDIASPSLTPIVVFGSTALSTPWLTEHNLAFQLSLSRPVLFVEPAVSVFSPFRWDTTMKEMLGVGRIKKISGDNHLYSLLPLTLPPTTSQTAKRWARPLLWTQVQVALRRLKISQPAVLLAALSPDLFDLSGERMRVVLIKDLNESRPDLFRRTKDDIVSETEAAVARADHIVVISRALQDSVVAQGYSATVLPHGFDSHLVASGGLEEPSDLAECPRPRLVYSGRIDGRLDYKALESLASKYETGTIIMIGPYSPLLDHNLIRNLSSRDNVRFLGQRDRQELMRYLWHADCGLLPYLGGPWAEHGSPLKLWDYLGAGLPIAGMGYTVLSDYPPPLVQFAAAPGEFNVAVETALQSSEDDRELRRKHALDNTWQRRADEFIQIVNLDSPN